MVVSAVLVKGSVSWVTDYCSRYGTKPTEYLYDLHLSGDPHDIRSDLSGNLDLYWEKADNSLIEIFIYENQMESDSTVYMKLEFQSKFEN